METFVFIVAGLMVLAGAAGVIASRNPVHAALSLVGTLFGIAVLFLNQGAHFLAAVQIIVYAGAIVVLFLFVIMLLGVDRAEDLRVEPLVGQRFAAVVVGLAVAALPIVAVIQAGRRATGRRSNLGSISSADRPDVAEIGEVLFTRYLFAFEITSVLLVIAVVGAVLLARRASIRDEIPTGADEEVDA